MASSISSRVGARGKIDPRHSKLAKDLGDQRLGRGIERARVNDAVAGRTKVSSSVAMADMPLENASASSASSHSARRSSRISWLGPLNRE